MKFRPQNVRARLTLWYVAVLAVVLLIYSAATSAVFFFHLRNQLDRLAAEDLETVEGFLTFDSSGRLFLRSDYHDHPYPAEQQERLMEVWSPDGGLLYRNEVLGQRALGGPPEPGEGVSSYSERSVRLSDGVRARVISKHHVVENRPTIIRLGFSEASLWRSFQESVLGLAAGLPLALGLAGLAGYFLARRALSPLDRMARRAHEINAERLDARLDVENPEDELGRLAAAFNETLARLEEAFDRLRRFTSDAAHELRTPLTAIRSVGEVGLQRNGSSKSSAEASAEHFREVIGSMLEESGRLSHLVDSLLTLARADAGQIRLRRDVIAVVPLVREVAALLDAVAEEKGLRLEVQGAVPAQVRGDRAILRQVLVNLLDNAIKHSPPGTQVWVRVIAEGGGEGERNVAIEVEDSGPGIAAAHRDRVFDRFYRVDEGRSREDGGAGLGLSIANWGAAAHGGRLELDCPDGRGCIFRLRLPAAIGSAETEPEAALRARVS